MKKIIMTKNKRMNLMMYRFKAVKDSGLGQEAEKKSVKIHHNKNNHKDIDIKKVAIMK